MGVSICRRLLRHLSHRVSSGLPMPASVQDLVDDLADALGRPVALEDRRWRLLASRAHTELGDPVRQASILARAAPPSVAAWLDTLDLDHAGDVVDTPANDA